MIRPGRADCIDLAPLRTGWVDGRLSAEQTDRLMRHLAVCPVCVREVRELGRVRALLSDTETSSAPSAQLADRLVRIAGAEAHQPLSTSALRRTRRRALPTPRRRRVRRVAVATVALVGVAAGTGYAAAPRDALAVVADPGTSTRAEFSATVAQLPFGSDAVAVVSLGRSKLLKTDSVPTPIPVPSAPTVAVQGAGPAAGSTAEAALGAVGEPAALELLERSQQAASSVAYQGTQRVQVALGTDGAGGGLDARVQISYRPGRGADVVVRTAAGRTVTESSLADGVTTRGDNPEALERLADGYALTGRTDVSWLGRPATLLDARSADGVLAARWWVDDASGLLLGQEVYAEGRLQLAVGFTELAIGADGATDRHRPAQLATVQTSAALLPSSAGGLVDAGWSCGPDLDGMDLVQLRSDSIADPDLLHMVYSDGLRTVSVFERRGRLEAAPAGTRYDAQKEAFVSTGFPATASWQSGDTVFTVVTDGDADLLARSVASLPHRGAPATTTMARIGAGWSRILHLG